jgi:hypothetical protein
MAWTAQSLQPALPIVEIVVSGTITHSDSDEMRRAVKSLLIQEGLERVLYDATDLTHVPTSTNIIRVAESMATTDLPAGFRDAHIRPADLTAAMWTDHWVAAANNRGITSAVFRTRAEAVDWLLAD